MAAENISMGAAGCIPFSLVKSVLRFCGVLCLRVAIGTGWVQHGRVLGRFRKARERRAPRIRARAAEGIMSGKAQDTEFRHPEAVAFLESLTDEQAAKQPPLSLEQDGVVTRQRREGGRVRCREFETDGGSGVRSFEMGALHAVVEAEFSRSLPLLEARDATLPSPSCPRCCGRRMERHSRAGRTFRTRLGPVQVERTYFRCRDCGVGFRQLDRTLGLESKTAAPGTESLYADAASSDSYEESGRKLKNLVGVEVPASTLQRHREARRRDAGVRTGGCRGRGARVEAGSARATES